MNTWGLSKLFESGLSVNIEINSVQLDIHRHEHTIWSLKSWVFPTGMEGKPNKHKTMADWDIAWLKLLLGYLWLVGKLGEVVIFLRVSVLQLDPPGVYSYKYSIHSAFSCTSWISEHHKSQHRKYFFCTDYSTGYFLWYQGMCQIAFVN